MNRTIAITVATGLLAAGATAGCAAAQPTTSAQSMVPALQAHGGYGRGHRESGGNGGFITLSGTATLTTGEKQKLQYLTEEEKLAHDLYVLAYDTYGLRVFANIAASETRHQQSMQRILTAYDISDKTQGLAAGTFSDPALQAQYDSLSAQVLQSQEAALQVGMLVEKADIADLKKARSGMPREVRQVLGQLLAASQQHLRAFTMWRS